MQYNKLLNDEPQYYKDHDFTYNNRRDVRGILKTIKTKYNQLKSRTYDITFYETKYDIYVDNSWWEILIYDNNDKNVLYLTEYGVRRIEHNDGYKNISTEPYTKLLGVRPRGYLRI